MPIPSHLDGGFNASLDGVVEGFREVIFLNDGQGRRFVVHEGRHDVDS